jgi:ParB/RepB/Spo0J family partition protein
LKEGKVEQTSTVESAPLIEPEFRSIPLEDLCESPLNPRRHFDAGELRELADSIRAHGVITPILARPLVDDNGTPFLEIVVGARRARAAKLAGLEEIPARVRELTDAQVLEVQVIENLQRADIHPLEEADGYRTLHLKHGYAIEDLAAKVGKSRGYVYARMRLCALVEPARKAFLEGKLTPSTALLVARIPDDGLQEKATADIVDDEMGTREASEHLQREYMLRLSDAPFNTSDPGLVPAAGACNTCPKRTGNQRELFGDVKSADVCTDPPCFARKRDAYWAIEKLAAEARGQKVLSEKEAKVVLSPYGGGPVAGSGYVERRGACFDDPKARSYGTLLGKRAKDLVVLARDPRTGGACELIPKAAAEKALKEAGHAWARPAAKTKSSPSSGKDRKEREARTRQNQELSDRVTVAALDQVVAAVELHDLSEKDWRMLAPSVIESAFLSDMTGLFETIVARRGLSDGNGKAKRSNGADLLLHALPKMKKPQVAGLAMELAISMLRPSSYSPPGSTTKGMPTQKDVFEHFGVDLKKVEASVKAEIAAAPKAITKDKAPQKKPAAKASKKAQRPSASA